MGDSIRPCRGTCFGRFLGAWFWILLLQIQALTGAVGVLAVVSHLDLGFLINRDPVDDLPLPQQEVPLVVRLDQCPMILYIQFH